MDFWPEDPEFPHLDDLFERPNAPVVDRYGLGRISGGLGVEAHLPKSGVSGSEALRALDPVEFERVRQAARRVGRPVVLLPMLRDEAAAAEVRLLGAFGITADELRSRVLSARTAIEGHKGRGDSHGRSDVRPPDC